MVTALTTSAILGSVTTDGLTLIALTNLLSSLGANALAGWLADWSQRKAGDFLNGTEIDGDKLLEIMSADLEQSLSNDVALSDDLASIFSQVDFIQLALDSLKSQEDNQTVLLQKITGDIPNYSGQLAEYLSTEVRIGFQQLENQIALLKGRLATAQRVNPPFVTPSEFFEPLLEKNTLFNHTWTLVGRATVLQDLHSFVASPELLVAVLTGRGGNGKSKLLHTFSLEFAVQHPTFTLVFVLENAALDRLDASDLPDCPCIIVVEDAHRRDDLETLITFARRRKQKTKLIFTTRPQGVDHLQVLLSQGLYDRRHMTWFPELRALTSGQVDELAEQVLAGHYPQLTKQLAALTKDCPLLTVVGGRLLVEEAVSPALLERHDDFRTVILQKFYDELLGQVSATIEPKRCREILQLLSGVSPFPVENESALTAAAKFLKMERAELISHLGLLEKSGITISRQHSVRIVPDVLSDYILFEACFAGNLSTRYARDLYDAFFDVCPTQILRNLAELDWRVRQSHGAGVDLLHDLWAQLREEFVRSSTTDRTRWLTILKDAALFQPQEALQLVEIALHDVPETSLLSTYADQRMLEVAVDVLRLIAYSPEYTGKCFDWLWIIGRNDNRQLHSNPGHATRRLSEMVGYSPNVAPWMNGVVLDCARRWLSDEGVDEYTYHPLDVVEPLFEKSGHYDYSDGPSRIRMEVYFVIPENTAIDRDHALDIVLYCAKSAKLRTSVRAVHILQKALRQPEAWFGIDVPETEISKWEPDDLRIVAHLNELLKVSTNPILQLEIVQALWWTSRYSRSTELRNAGSAVLHELPSSFEFRLAKVMFYLHGHLSDDLDETAADPYADSFARRLQECEAVASELVELLPDPVEGFNILEKLLRYAAQARIGHGFEPQTFFQKLASTQPVYSACLCDHILSNPEARLTPYMGVLTSAIRQANPVRVRDILKQALDSENLVSIRAIAGSYSWVIPATVAPSEDFPIVSRLVHHPDLQVRNAGLSSLTALGQVAPRIALDLIQSLEIGESNVLAETACDVINNLEKAEPQSVTGDDLKSLLHKLRHVSDISDYGINSFLVLASYKLPSDVVDLLLWRVKHGEEGGHSGFTALPHGGFHSKLEGLRASPEYKDNLRKARQLALEDESGYSYWIPRLYEELSFNFESEGLAVLAEWLDSGEARKYETLGMLLSNVFSNFVFANETFVVALLNAAHAVSGACYDEVVGDLHQSALGGTRSGAVGEPFPQDVKVRDEANLAMQRHPVGTRAHSFYTLLLERAKARIADQMKREEVDFQDELD